MDSPAAHDPAVTAPDDIRFCARCATPMASRPIGDKLRRVCPACRYVHFVEPRVGVGVMVVEGGRLLLVKRKMPPEAGKWSLPAGFLDYGEDPRETAARETREETGLEVRVGDLVDVFHNPIGPDPARGASVFVLFRAQGCGGELRPGDDAEEAAFFALGSLPCLAFASTLAAVEALRRELDC